MPNEIIVWDEKRENILRRYSKGDNKINDDDEFLTLITDTYDYLQSIDEKAELKQAFNKLNIWKGEEIQPMQICDRRTLELLSAYEFYKYSPEKAFPLDYQVWFDAYILLNKYQPRLF